jgi:hypothetical protein
MRARWGVFIGADIATVEHLIRTCKLAYVEHGTQRGGLIPVESLRHSLRDYLQEAIWELPCRARRKSE